LQYFFILRESRRRLRGSGIMRSMRRKLENAIFAVPA
jgi:hypothetical protein